MQTRSLETLVRISQVESFSEAAELQSMTLSALSMQMKALEMELGVDLFDRNFRPPRLTPVGRQVAEKAQAVIANTQDLKNLCVPHDGLVGHFRLGFIQSASVRILPDFIETVQERAINATFAYVSGLSEKLTELVLANQLDAAVVTQVDANKEGLQFDMLASEELALVVPAAFAQTPLAALPNVLCFIHFMPSTGIGKLIATRLATLSQKPREVLVLDNIESALECVKRGFGYTILPLPDVVRYRGEGIFVHPPGPSRFGRTLSLVSRSDLQSDQWRSKLLDLFGQ